jgi:hypothetical protein
MRRDGGSILDSWCLPATVEDPRLGPLVTKEVVAHSLVKSGGEDRNSARFRHSILLAAGPRNHGSRAPQKGALPHWQVEPAKGPAGSHPSALHGPRANAERKRRRFNPLHHSACNAWGLALRTGPLSVPGRCPRSPPAQLGAIGRSCCHGDCARRASANVTAFRISPAVAPPRRKSGWM